MKTIGRFFIGICSFVCDIVGATLLAIGFMAALIVVLILLIPTIAVALILFLGFIILEFSSNIDLAEIPKKIKGFTEDL